MTKNKLTPPEIATMWGISADKVLGWIRCGELRATNIAARRDARPRYVVGLDDLAEFEKRRSNVRSAQDAR